MIEQERDARIAELVCEGKSLSDVAKIVGLTQPRVTQIMQKNRREWAARETVAVADHIQIQLAKLKKTHDQAEATYQKSLEDAKKVVTFRSETGENETVTVEGQAGDTAALGIKLRCIEMALKLLNAFPKDTQEQNVVINQWNWPELAKPIPANEPIQITPSSEVEAKIAAVLNEPQKPNGNGHA